MTDFKVSNVDHFLLSTQPVLKRNVSPDSKTVDSLKLFKLLVSLFRRAVQIFYRTTIPKITACLGIGYKTFRDRVFCRNILGPNFCLDNLLGQMFLGIFFEATFLSKYLLGKIFGTSFKFFDQIFRATHFLNNFKPNFFLATVVSKLSRKIGSKILKNWLGKICPKKFLQIKISSRNIRTEAFSTKNFHLTFSMP